MSNRSHVRTGSAASNIRAASVTASACGSNSNGTSCGVTTPASTSSSSTNSLTIAQHIRSTTHHSHQHTHSHPHQHLHLHHQHPQSHFTFSFAPGSSSPISLRAGRQARGSFASSVTHSLSGMVSAGSGSSGNTQPPVMAPASITTAAGSSSNGGGSATTGGNTTALCVISHVNSNNIFNAGTSNSNNGGGGLGNINLICSGGGGTSGANFSAAAGGVGMGICGGISSTMGPSSAAITGVPPIGLGIATGIGNKMLGRKQSLKGGEPFLADYGPEESLNESADIEWVNKLWVRRLMRLCALVSLTTVSLNTPKTFERHPSLQYITFVSDTAVTLLFSAEMIAKMHIRGVLHGEVPYLKDHWCQFDASMVFFLWVSIILQVFEVIDVVPKFSYLSIMRAPRPLIMIRFLRVFLKFSMPKSRINQIFK